MTSSNPAIAELKACAHCGTAMVDHGHCFSHPRPSSGDCILRHYSFDKQKAAAWNTRVSTPPPSIEPEAADRGVSEAERIGPLQFERPVGRNFEEWCANVRKGDLYRRGDTVLVWVNEGDIIAHQMALQSLRSEQEDGR